VIDVSNENVSGYFLLLKMAFQTKRCVALVQQSLVNRPVRRMANCTSLPHCFMLIHKRAPLLCVTLEAGLVWAQESKAAAFECLLNIRRHTLGRDPLVRLVTIGAAHFAFWHRMVMGQLERRANVQMTLETRFRRFPRIDDCVRRAAAFYVQTPRPVTGFAAHVLGVFTFCLKSRVRGCPEIARDLFVASRTFL